MGHGRSRIQAMAFSSDQTTWVNRFRGSAEGRTIKRRNRGRCGQSGHIARKCSLGVHLGFGHDDTIDNAAATAEAEKAAKAVAVAVSASMCVFDCFVH